MDKQIQKKYWTNKKLLFAALMIGTTCLVYFGLNAISQKTYLINSDRITIDLVAEREFQDVILIDGLVKPITSVLVNHPNGGTVETVFVEAGNLVEKGTPLLKLSNPSLTLAFMNQETAIVEQISSLQNLKLALNKDQRSLEESLIDIEYKYASTSRNFVNDTALYSADILAKNIMEDSKNKYKYQKEKYSFIKEHVAKSDVESQMQLQSINRSIKLMERNLDLIHSNMNKMLVRAPVAGEISSFDPIIGQSYLANQTLAKIDSKEGYKVQAEIDEFYLATVKAGYTARFILDKQSYTLQVKRIFPEVVNGHFEIELVFVDAIPTAITTGQSLQLKLELSKTKMALTIPKGKFFHAFGGKYVFVVNEEGNAVKRQIGIGRQNPSYYEILDGLDQGEEFISSSYELYKNFENITLTSK